MRNMLEYNYRTRTNADGMCFAKEDNDDKPMFDRFSLPPKAQADAEEFTIIKRPEIPELKGFVEKYL